MSTLLVSSQHLELSLLISVEYIDTVFLIFSRAVIHLLFLFVIFIIIIILF
jgi:hypothetical protein